MVRKHFGTDGIRGQANKAITPELAMKVAQATGILFQRGDRRREGGDKGGARRREGAATRGERAAGAAPRKPHVEHSHKIAVA